MTHSGRPVRLAVIPVAGLGTRMYPAAKMIRKELFPVITPNGRCICLLQRILEEALEAGIEEFLLIVNPGDLKTYQDFFAPVDPAVAEHLPHRALEDCRQLEKIGRRVSFAFQEEQLGFGHAVYSAAEWCDGEPFLLILSDHIYESTTGTSCTWQLMDAWNSLDASAGIASFYPVPLDQVRHYGTACGAWTDEKQRVFQVESFIEKPSPEYAAEHLAMPGLPDDHFFCIYGQYILSSEIFEILEYQIQKGLKVKGEFQLTTALDELVRQGRFHGYAVQGKHYDTGQPLNYLHSLAAFGKLL